MASATAVASSNSATRPGGHGPAQRLSEQPEPGLAAVQQPGLAAVKQPGPSVAHELGGQQTGRTAQAATRTPEGYLGRRCGGCVGVPLRYYGGPVQHQPEVHVIFWGKNWNEPTGPGPRLREEVLNFYHGLSNSPSGSAFQGILVQYFDESGRVSSTLENAQITSFTDEGVPAPTNVNDADLQYEAQAAAENPKNRWLLGPNAQFVIIPAPGATYESNFDHSFCAYHSIVRTGATFWTYTFLPYYGEEPFEAGCLSYDHDGAASHDEKAGHVLSMDAAHEYAESATDPAFSAWLNREGYEIADICSSGDDELANKSWVQGLWDDHQSACSLEDSNPPHVLGLTEPPSNVGEHEATLNATVNVENERLETRYRIEYGPTTAYGKSAPAEGYVDVGNRSGNQLVHQTVSALQQEATYHYRVVAANSNGETTSGEDHTFVPSQWSSGDIPLLAGVGQASFGSALISCSFQPWSCGGASCPSRATCVAVGSYEWYGTEAPMADTWNGAQWSFDALPVPEGTGSQVALTGVSCTSAEACLTVGYERNTAGVRVPVADRLNGTEGWSVSSMVSPSGAKEAGLEGVSCISSAECMAVGLTVSGSGEKQPYAALWSKGRWSIQPLNPPEAANAILEGISCPSVKSCVAVGFSENGAGAKTALTETWNGGTWSATSAPAPPEGGNFALSGVSCALPTSCMAVGAYAASKGVASLAERWDGAKWTVQSPPSSGYQEEFIGVSCPTSEECTAVGAYEPHERWVALVQTWNGVAWSEQASNVDEAQASELHAVSCSLGSTCSAVGLTGWSSGARSRTGFVEPLAEMRLSGPNATSGRPTEPAGAQSATPALPTVQLVQTAAGAGAVLARHAAAVRCKVPRLIRDSVTRARRLLRNAHCALGRVARPRHSSGRLVIRRQSHTPGASLAAGTKINVMMGRARPIG